MINRALVRELGTTFAQSEQWKRDPAKVPSFHRLHKTIEPMLADLAKEICQSLALFRKAYPEKRVEQLWLTGGGACLHGLLGHLRQEMTPVGILREANKAEPAVRARPEPAVS